MWNVRLHNLICMCQLLEEPAASHLQGRREKSKIKLWSCTTTCCWNIVFHTTVVTSYKTKQSHNLEEQNLFLCYCNYFNLTLMYTCCRINSFSCCNCCHPGQVLNISIQKYVNWLSVQEWCRSCHFYCSTKWREWHVLPFLCEGDLI